MTQLDKNTTYPTPSDEELDEYVEAVFDSGEGSRDRYAVIVVDDEGEAHTLSAGQDRSGEYVLMEVFEGRPKNRNARRVTWFDLPETCRYLFWQQVGQINQRYR